MHLTPNYGYFLCLNTCCNKILVKGPLAVSDLIGGIIYTSLKSPGKYQGPLLLTWFNFNPSMDK